MAFLRRLDPKSKETFTMYGTQVPRYADCNHGHINGIDRKGLPPFHCSVCLIKRPPAPSKSAFTIPSIKSRTQSVFTAHGRDFFVDKKGDVIADRPHKEIERGNPEWRT
jgi:hypothetical protein